MKPIALALFAALLLGGALAPVLTGCSDDKSGTPPQSPTTQMQTVSADGGPSGSSSGGAPSGGW
jgi:hypothetical protein